LWWIDGALGIGVSLLIIWAAVDIVRSTSSILLGEAPDEEMRQAVLDSVHKEAPEVDDVHHLHLHRYGHTVEITLHLRLPSRMSVGKSHEIGHRIEERLRQDLQVEPTVHIEPTLD
jgi:divalent metal cation (Fe/Co/Zn/Cd) transporter